MMTTIQVVTVTYLRAASVTTRDVSGDAARSDSELDLTTSTTTLPHLTFHFSSRRPITTAAAAAAHARDRTRCAACSM